MAAVATGVDRGASRVNAVPVDGSVQRENSGFYAPGQSPIQINIDQVDMSVSRTIPLLTAPAGKSYTITDIYLDHDGNTAVRIALSVGLTPTSLISRFSAPVKGDTAPVQTTGMQTQIDVPAGHTLYLSWALQAQVNLYANIAGQQQSIGAG